MNRSIAFRNDSSEAIPPGAVMRQVGTTFVDDNLVLLMGKPTAEYRRFYYINGSVTVPAGEYGDCYTLTDAAQGYVGARTNAFSAPAEGESWGPRPNSWDLQSAGFGFTTLGNTQSGFIFVRQHEVTTVMGVLLEALSDQGSANTALLVASQSSPVQSDFRITVYDSMLPTSTRLPIQTRIVATWAAGRWWLVSASACPSAILA